MSHDALRLDMTTVSIRELRNHGGDVLARVEKGETLIVTRSGRAVAELRPVDSRGADTASVLSAFRNLPPIDADRFRADVDALFEPGL